MNDRRHPLSGMRPPRPPAPLRQQVLARLGEESAAPAGWIDRIWENRGLRIAAGLTAALLVLLQLFQTRERLAVQGSVRVESRPEFIVIDGLRLPIREALPTKDAHVATLLSEPDS